MALVVRLPRNLALVRFRTNTDVSEPRMREMATLKVR